MFRLSHKENGLVSQVEFVGLVCVFLNSVTLHTNDSKATLSAIKGNATQKHHILGIGASNCSLMRFSPGGACSLGTRLL